MTATETYSEAKKLLNACAPDRVICRNNETAELEDYILTCFETKKSMSIYVNGQPGTGKTLSVNHILDNLKQSYKFKKISINCMSVKNISSLYKIMITELSTSESSNLTPSKRNNKENAAKTVDTLITTSKTNIVLLLDEIDQIDSKCSSDLYKIFEWPYLKNSRLILIGIANSLDFTDRLLPRLELKPECKPKIVKFLPYSKEDIISIIKERLSSVKTCVVIDDRALTLCASKIASTNGDIRKVLDICRRAVELIEQELKFAGSSSSQQPADSSPVKSVGIAHMMRVFNEINPMTNSNLDKSTMPLMQKILLCTILLCSKDMKIKEIVLSKLYDKFNKVCKTYSTAMESESEFVNLCTMIQDSGLIDMKKAKEIRNYKISLRIDEQDLVDKLQDENFMADILTNKLYK
jgi:cell division control protein 6